MGEKVVGESDELMTCPCFNVLPFLFVLYLNGVN